MFAWDYHLNQIVAVRNLTVDGFTRSYFNPNNFTGEPFFLSLAQFGPGWSEFKPGDQLYAFQYAVDCVLPISGIYCPLNKWLFFAEVFFGLGALSLSYEWLSVISIAAALNYTAVAAIHAILIFFTGTLHTAYFRYDIPILFEILGAAVLLAHPLQQWSQTLQKRTFAQTRFILACWTVLVCTAFILVDMDSHPVVIPTIEIENSSIIPRQFSLVWEDFFCDNCRNDTINPFPFAITPQQWDDLGLIAGPCPNTDPVYASLLYSDQTLVQDRFSINSLSFSRAFQGLNYVFSVYAAVNSIATIALALHGQHSTHFVRAKIYLWLRGNGNISWRSQAALLFAFIYHGIQFVVGIISLPIVLVAIVIWEYTSAWTPTSEQPSDIGQWGPCVGALLVAFVVILNTGSTAYMLRSTLSWMLFTPAHTLFPTKFKRRHLPRLEIDWIPLYRIQGLPSWLALFFIEEYLSTREWLQNPYGASLNCMMEEEAKSIEAPEGLGKSKVVLMITPHAHA